MGSIAEFKKARSLNKEGKPRAALNILKNLYKLDASNLDIILEVVTGFENLGERGKARAMLSKGIRLFPQNYGLWIRLSRIYQADKNLETALKALNKGLFYNPNNLPLLAQKSHLLADLDRVDEMRSLVDATIKKHPDNKKDLLIERASIYQRLSLHPDDAEEQLKDCCGIVYAVGPLKKAINDLNDAMDCDEEDFRIPLKIARLYKQLKDFELAIFTYDSALSALSSEAEEFRISIQQERDDCLNVSLNDAEEIENPLRGELLNIKAKSEVLKDSAIANNLPDVKENQLTQAKDSALINIDMQDNPDQKIANSIAQNIPKNVRDPNADFTPTKLDKAARKFCDKVEKEIKKMGFLKLGDFEPKGFKPYLGKRVFLRFFVSSDSQISATAIEIKPLKPSFLAWLLLVVLGKWKTIRYVELQSETDDGFIKITNNSGEVNPFVAGNPVKIMNLSVKSSIYDLVLTHKIRLQQDSQKSHILIPDQNEFFAFQKRVRLAKNAYRKSLVFVMDEQLKQMPGNKFEKFLRDIRSYLDKIAGQTCDVKT